MVNRVIFCRSLLNVNARIEIENLPEPQGRPVWEYELDEKSGNLTAKPVRKGGGDENERG